MGLTYEQRLAIGVSTFQTPVIIAGIVINDRKIRSVSRQFDRCADEMLRNMDAIFGESSERVSGSTDERTDSL
jgi:hypothetical protein